MIKHIVAWKLKETAHNNTKKENALIIKEKLEALKEKISQIKALEVGVDFSNTESSSDIVLITEFDSKETLEEYQVHADHKAVVPFIVEAASERRLVDFEM